MFTLLVILCMLLGLAFVLWPFMRPGNEFSARQRNALNVDLHKEALTEFDKQLEQGDIDAQGYAQLKLEAEQKLLADYHDETERSPSVIPRWVGLIAAVLLVVITAAVYQKMGAYTDWQLTQTYQGLANAGEDDKARYEQFVDDVASYADTSLHSNDWWFVAAQGFMALDKYPQAVEAFKKVQVALPEDTSVMANLGQAMYLANNRTLSVDAKYWLDKALQGNPHNTTALGVLGISAFEQGEYQTAITHWEKALTQLPPFSRQAQVLSQGVQNAKQALGQVGNDGTNTEAAVTGKQIKVTLSLANDVTYAPDNSVFVFARAVNGPRFPLAAVKVNASELPKTVLLDSGSAMQPGMTIDSFNPVIVTARLSRSNDPIATAGDWQSEQKELTLGDEPAEVQLVINQSVSQ